MEDETPYADADIEELRPTLAAFVEAVWAADSDDGEHASDSTRSMLFLMLVRDYGRAPGGGYWFEFQDADHRVSILPAGEALTADELFAAFMGTEAEMARRLRYLVRLREAAAGRRETVQ